ncbi:hypothetical protein TH66_10480 [Carbonactinospora thermoautotrophica]|uniref:Uncharacterized protein n=1 Tax=Carbonactinospora thermoautotrophica TaxID=1469144 RepID=A0A132N895_9ACTN|nr:hypothetical protein TH66_10480 [Carbonactinospora thermoautotrophica]KWX06348.1 hypothetical protein TR74_22345 [Carbonactinospora thermoautotrophica]
MTVEFPVEIETRDRVLTAQAPKAATVALSWELTSRLGLEKVCDMHTRELLVARLHVDFCRQASAACRVHVLPSRG